jgi:homoserine dehydrogenase
LCLRELQRQSYTHYFYEATVGAGLPIISTLRGLNETGDKIIKIEGILRYMICIPSIAATNDVFAGPK